MFLLCARSNFFYGQSFFLASASILVNTGGKSLKSFVGLEQECQTCGDGETQARSENPERDMSRSSSLTLQTRLAKTAKLKNNYVTATFGSRLQVLAFLTSFNQRQSGAL